jgi:hypothetical protein
VLALRYDEIIRQSENVVRKELFKATEPLIELGLSSEEADQVQQLTSRILDATFFKFPTSCVNKLGYMSYGIIKVAEEIRIEADRLVGRPFDERTYYSHFQGDLKSDFERQYAVYSGMNYEEAGMPRNWVEKHYGRSDEVLDWGKDTLANILEKIDFNGKAISKATVRLSGMIVCFAGAIAKCASLIMVNPVQNVLAINALVAGGVLAVHPEKAEKLVQKLNTLKQ